MKRPAVLFAIAAALATAVAQPAPGRTVTFDHDRPGQPPGGFSCALTGRGRAGVWQVVADATAPSAPHVVAQTDEDATSYRFPLCVLDDVSAADVDLSVRFKPIRGGVDQAAGLVWRYRDPDNYYVVRANAREGNVVLYKVEGGKRSDLDPKGTGLFAYGKKVDVPSGAWSTLRVVAQGHLFTVHVNGRQIFEVEDATFATAGRVGVWTKADSLTYFDDLGVAVSR